MSLNKISINDTTTVNTGIVYDISKAHGGATYTDLADALGTDGINVPLEIREGGMSIRFVQTSDNKYIQFCLMSDTWSINTEDWAIADESVYVDNPEFVYVKTDKEDKILWAIRTDGDIYFGAGCPQQVIDYVEERISSLSLDEYEDIVTFLSDYLGSDTTLKAMIDGINAQIANKLDAEGLDPDALETIQVVENPEYIQVTTDSEDKVLEGTKTDGTKVIGGDLQVNGNIINVGIQGQIDAAIEEMQEEVNEMLEESSEKLSYFESAENSEWTQVTTDVEGKILEGITSEGKKKVMVETEIQGVNVIEAINNLQEEIKGKCGLYYYPFRMLTGKPVFLYKDSLCSGFRPEYNYELYTTVARAQDYTPHAFRVLINDPGSYILNFGVKEKNEIVITEKAINVVVRNAPSVKLANKEVLNVFWLGDSLIGQNANAIGNEWKRMLSTNDSEEHVNTDKSIQLPTLNLCPNKLNLVGENRIGSFAPYQYTFKVHQWLVGKRNSDWGGDIDLITENPFYNPFSTEPDEIGEDGFNKRVDFAWYFDHAIGEGKYPDLIYLCIGVNDLVDTYKWKYSGIPYVVDDVVAFCKKIKSVCDAIAGGNSGLKIKMFNHQTYTLFNSTHYFPQMRQRLLWQKYYDAVYEAIQNPNNGISSFVELIDCSSKFDWRVGYAKTDESYNNRYDGIQDIHYNDTVHMNLVGAYNYADCLIDDFIADEYFD